MNDSHASAAPTPGPTPGPVAGSTAGASPGADPGAAPPEAPGTGGTRTRGGRRRRPLRAALVAALSLLVVGGMVAFVLVPTTPSVQVTMSELDEAASAARGVGDATEVEAEQEPASGSAPTGRQVVYGTIDVRGVPVDDVTVTLVGTAPGTEGQEAVIRVDEPGPFRSVVHLVPGAYEVTVSLTIGRGSGPEGGREPVDITMRRDLADGASYGLEIQVREGGVVTFFPISVY